MDDIMVDEFTRATPVHDECTELGGDVDDRDQTADDRDHVAAAIDVASEARDERAEARDERAEARDESSGRFDPAAASDRAGARRDRQGGAVDRRHAQDDREAASTDRSLSALERELSLIDGLTGASRRDAGMLDLEREVARANRTQRQFVLVFVDVDGLKATNDSLGHTAGDDLLRLVVQTIRTHLRPYDLVVRYGGDEFLCGLPELGFAQAAERFAKIHDDLASTAHVSVTAGITELDPDESLADLIARADAALYQQRSTKRA